ncbi:MAG: acylglycerol kinase family protein [Leptolyngbyaceae cyanobacterium CSU_1_4]|nr:acylglycerol kinase family protein [Leptolyngbyaceae cyanobacterium CSU_1_4]
MSSLCTPLSQVQTDRKKLEMNTLLIVNPTSGSAENPQLITDLTETLNRQGIQADIHTTTPDEDGEGLAIEAVARGLMHTQTVLGIIPLGTRNNIAASLNIPSDWAQAIQIVARGDRDQFDMGKANHYYFDGSRRRRARSFPFSLWG